MGGFLCFLVNIMQKGTLNPNILKKAKQRFFVPGLPPVLVLTRATLFDEIGVITLPDGTHVAGMDQSGGDFTITIQFGDDEARNAYLGWFDDAIDKAGRGGVNPDYKRDGEILFLRSHRQNRRTRPLSGDSGSAKEVRVIVEGVWCQKYVIPEADIDAADGDGYSQMECTLSYDDIDLEFD